MLSPNLKCSLVVSNAGTIELHVVILTWLRCFGVSILQLGLVDEKISETHIGYLVSLLAVYLTPSILIYNHNLLDC